MFSISTTSNSPSDRLLLLLLRRLLLLLLTWLSLQRHLSTDAVQSFDSTCKSANEYLDAMYRCRSGDFQVISFCSSSSSPSPHELGCGKSNRVAVFSASVGRSSDDECSQSTTLMSNRSLASSNADAECCVLHVLEDKCHGKQRCNLSVGEWLQSADGRQCAPRKRNQHQQQSITVVFICVNQTTFKELKRDRTSPDAFCDGRLEAKRDDSRNRQQPFDPFRPENHRPTTDRLPLTKTAELTSAGFGVSGADQSGPTSVYRGGGGSIDWIWSMVFIRDNMDRFLVYLFMSIAVGLILVLSVVILGSCFGRYWRRRSKTKVHVTQTSTQTNDVTAALVASNYAQGIEMVHYSHTDSLRAPRSNGTSSLAGNSVHFASDNNSSAYQGMRRTVNGGSTYLNAPLYQINSSADSMDGGGSTVDRIMVDHDNDYRSNTLGRFYTNPYRHDSYRSDGYRTLQHK